MLLARRTGNMFQMLPRGAAFCVFSAIGLVACTTTQQRAQDSATSTVVTSPPGLAGQNGPQAAIALQAPPPVSSQLLGMTPVHVTALLGQPELIRFEPPAQVWLYRNQSCVFHVYLYTTSGNAGYNVSHIAAVSLRGQPLAVDSCFAETVTGASLRAQSS